MLLSLTAKNHGISFDSLRREMDDAFRELFGSCEPCTPVVHRSIGDALTIWEDDTSVFIEVDVPGFVKDELELTINDGILSIRGERKLPERDGEIVHNGRRFGQFERAVSLPDSIDTASVEAEIENGVLKLLLLKKESEVPKRIEIK